MLDLKEIVNNSNSIKEKLTSRGFDISVIDDILNLSKERTQVMTEMQNLEADRNKLSKEIGIAKSQGKDASEIMQKVSNIKEQIDLIKEKETNVNSKIRDILLYVPNTPLDEVPLGKDDNDNKIINEFSNLGRGKVTNVVPHYDIATKLDIVDFERAVKLSGSRFWAYKGDGSRLVRSLENFMLDTHVSNGYVEWRPPIIVKSNILEGTGQLPKFHEDLFKIENKDMYLIPTAEVPITNLHNDEILDLSSPISYTAFTPCFRAEAGSGGKDMRGLIRAHQFNKVELVKFVSQEDSELEFQKTLKDAKNILEKLELPYREIMLCTGDLGFSSQKTIDLEVWIPSESRYRETSSVSLFGDYQGRRASIRYKNSDGKNVSAYTINGSGVAIDRVIASILEVYQNDDGTITVPKALVKYMGKEIIK